MRAMREVRFVAWLVFAFGALFGLACGPAEERVAEAPAPVAPAPPAPTVPAVPKAAPPASAPQSDRPLVAFLGDSLTAGLGLEADLAFPALVEDRLAAAGRPIRVLNAGVSGDTSAGGLRRVDWILKQDPDVVVVGLGANDGLRGVPLEETERNLRAIVERVQATGARVLLLGMQIPPNYGPEYAGGFAAMYPRVASELGVPLVPFLLEGVGGDPDLNLPDGIHPNAEGQERVADNVVPYLEQVLAAAPAPS